MADPAVLWHGPTINVTLNGNVRRGQTIRHNGTNYVAADSDDGEAEFIALGQGLSGEIIRATQQAEIEDLDAPFTAGGELFTSATAGAIATAAPATGALQVIGHAVSTTKAMVNIRKSEWEQTVVAFSPRSDDGQALGTASLKWSDLFLAAGGVINFNNGDVTITHGTNTLDFAGASSGYSFDAGVAVNSTAGIATTATTFPLVNTTATTVNFAGAATTIAIGAAASVSTWTGQSISFTGANSTNNTTLTVTNSSNAAAASHSILDVAVGGTTSTGDPQVRLTIPGGTSWYIGVDNSVSDILYLGTGTTVGSSPVLSFDRATTGAASIVRLSVSAVNATLSDGASAKLVNIGLGDPLTATLSGTTQVTGLWASLDLTGIITIAQSGGAVTVDKYAQIAATPAILGASVTLTHSSAFRAVNPGATAGTLTNMSGLYVEALTRGAANYQILMINGGTEPTSAPADHVGLYAVDLSAGNATLGIVTETAVVTETVTSDRTLSVRINGTTFKICLKV